MCDTTSAHFVTSVPCWGFLGEKSSQILALNQSLPRVFRVLQHVVAPASSHPDTSWILPLQSINIRTYLFREWMTQRVSVTRTARISISHWSASFHGYHWSINHWSVIFIAPHELHVSGCECSTCDRAAAQEASFQCCWHIQSVDLTHNAFLRPSSERWLLKGWLRLP